MAGTKGGKKMASVAVMPKFEYDGAKDLARKTVCLVVNFGRLGNSRKVASSHVEVDADKELIKVQKILLDSEELRNIQRLDWEVGTYLETVCLPFPANGARLAPLESVPQITERLDAFKERRKALVDKFMAAYPRLMETAEKRLRSEFNRKDYPRAAAVREKFYFTYQYVSFGVPGQLKEISKAIFDKEQKKAEAVLKDAATEATKTLREAMGTLVTHLAQRLTSDPKRDGKPKILKASAVQNLVDFLDGFDKLNVVNDGELKREVEKARKLITGVNADKLRENDGLREMVREGMEKIGAKLETMVVNTPSRLFLDAD